MLTSTYGVFAGANTALVASGLAMAGQLAINALIPPPTPKGLGSIGAPFQQQLNSQTGTQNNASCRPTRAGSRRTAVHPAACVPAPC